MTCIADGADRITQAVLNHGGTLHVIIPATSYRDGLPAEHHATYGALLSKAVDRLDFTASNSEAHMAASLHMIDIISELIAVWDGKPARGYGGTADVVKAAREQGRPIHTIWPPGASRN